jgi:hypothetical protein
VKASGPFYLSVDKCRLRLHLISRCDIFRILFNKGHAMSVRDAKTEALFDMLLLRAQLARESKGMTKRDEIVKSLSQTANRIVRPKFDARKFRDALVSACTEKPDFGDPVVLDQGDKIHLNGTFDLRELASVYYATRGETIDGEVVQA